MIVKKGRMVSLGHGKFVRADRITAVEPIVEGRGAGNRTRVFVAGIEDPLIASRTESTILRDAVGEAATEREQRLAALLYRILNAVEKINPTVRSIVHDQGGLDLTRVELEIRASLDEARGEEDIASKQTGLF